MKGLLLKDFLQLKTYVKSMSIILIMYSFMIFSEENVNSMMSLATTIFMILGTMIALSTFTRDEKGNINRYLLTLPVDKKDLVKEKYALCLITILIGALFGTIISLVAIKLTAKPFPNIEDFLSSVLGGITGVSLLVGLQIPFMYKFGAEKGRISIYVLAIIIIFISSIPNLFHWHINFTIPTIMDKLLPIVLLLIIAMIYLVSYFISLKIVEKKDL